MSYPISYRRVRAICIKELHHITRDSRSLAMALGVPVLMLVLFGYALSLDVDRIPTMLYDQSQTAESRALVRQFEGSRFFEIRGMVKNYATIERGIDRSRVLMGVVIPLDYAKKLAAAQDAQVQILLDGSDSNTASIALGYAESLVRGYSLELRTAALNRRGGEHLAPPVDARLRVWYNSSLESKNYVVPGLIAVVLQIIASLLTSLTIAREWEMGTMEQILSTPLRPAEMVLGKMLAYFAVGLADATIAVLVGVFVFEVPFRGSLPLLGVSTCVFLFGALFWGIFVSAAARTQVAAYQMGILSSFLPAFLLSGFVYSIESMPWVIQAITHIIPARYVVTILKGIFLKGVGLSVLWGELGFLTLYAIIVFLLATRKLNQKLV
jgi:ABC-2 type transport system permease protein